MSAEAQRERFWRINNPIVWGLVATVSIVVISIVLAFMPTCLETDCGTKWEAFKFATPNEVGDTLAGIAGSLAFIWIIATVWLQSQELAAQRQELQLNRKESAKMANALTTQADIFKDEQKQRSEIKYEQTLDQIIEGLVDRMSSFPLNEISWTTSGRNFADIDDDDEVIDYLFKIDGDPYSGREVVLTSKSERDRFLKMQASHLQLSSSDFIANTKSQYVRDKPEPPIALLAVISDLDRILGLAPELSDAQYERVKNLRIEETRKLLQRLTHQPSLWADSELGDIDP